VNNDLLQIHTHDYEDAYLIIDIRSSLDDKTPCKTKLSIIYQDQTEAHGQNKEYATIYI